MEQSLEPGTFLTIDGLMDSHYALQAALATSMINVFGLISGALVGSYLVADKLDRITTVIVVALFTLIISGVTMEGFHLGNDLYNAGMELRRRGADPSAGIGWLTTVRQQLPIGHIPLTALIFYPTLYLGVLIFFFRLRWARLKKRGGIRPSLDEL